MVPATVIWTSGAPCRPGKRLPVSRRQRFPLFLGRPMVGGPPRAPRAAVVTARQTRRKPIAASIARGMKTCRRRKPLDARMIGRQGVFQIKDGPKRTALENLKTAGAQQAHN